jgi:hypothetical protein
MEHRWGQRVRIEMPIRLTGRSFEQTAAKLVDVSLSGAFVVVDRDIRILCQIQVALNVPHILAPNTMSLNAHVIRKEPQGIGIEWASLAPASYATLLRMASLWREEDRARAEPPGTWLQVPSLEPVNAPRISARRHGPRPARQASRDCKMLTDEHSIL